MLIFCKLLNKYININKQAEALSAELSCYADEVSKSASILNSATEEMIASVNRFRLQ